MKNLILLEPQHLVSSGLTALLKEHNLFGKIISVVSGKSLLNTINQSEVSVVVMSTTVDDVSVLALLKKLKRDLPEIKVLILANKTNLLVAKNFLNAGANGYITKTATADEFINALKILQQNKTVIPEMVSQDTSSLGNEGVRLLTNSVEKKQLFCCKCLKENQSKRYHSYCT